MGATVNVALRHLHRAKYRKPHAAYVSSVRSNPESEVLFSSAEVKLKRIKLSLPC